MILDIIIALFAILFVCCFIINRILKIKRHGLSSMCSGNCSGCLQKCSYFKEKLK